jgi:hypothetical protein
VVKQRLEDAGLPERLSPDSLWVTAITDPRCRCVTPDDVQ